MKQREYIGPGCLVNLKSILNNYSINRIFLVTGRNSYSISGAKDKIENILNDYHVCRFSGFSENPRLEDLTKGVRLFNKFKGELIISIGGGTVLDMGKLISAFSNITDNPENYIKNGIIDFKKSDSIIAIPTTAGSGSEATQFAVLYIDGVKYSVAHSLLLPEYVIIDPILTYSMSPDLTAVTGIDALCQAIESYWAVDATDESRIFAADALKIIVNRLKKAVHDPDPETRNLMSRAANLSGKAINISKTTAAHAISYTLTMKFGVKHGHAVALTLGKFFKINYNARNGQCNGNLDASRVRRVMNDLFKIMGFDNYNECDIFISELMGELDLKTKLRSFGLNNTTDIETIVRNVNLERIDNNPVKISEEVLYEILYEIY